MAELNELTLNGNNYTFEDDVAKGLATTEASRAQAAEQTLQTAIDIINGKIPAQATAQNQLADKDFVNSSVGTATADFKGTYNSLQELQQVTANANDYAFVIATDAAGNTVYKRYKWVEGTGWSFEYDLNNSSFTAAQWAAIQSGITAALVTKLSDLPTNAELNQRVQTAIANALTSYYTKSEVDTSLGNKQDTISDLSDIRSGAQAGSTAVQPSMLNNVVKNTVAESGVYDVSANNDNTKFESLSALLRSANLSTLIPTDIRKGGMSIKFVQSSDNNYAQYLYVGTSIAIADFTNEANWEKTNLERGVKELNQDVNGKYDYSFYAATGEHSSTLDLFPIDCKTGTIIKGKISLGTAKWNGANLSVYLRTDSVVAKFKAITIGQEFEISSNVDVKFISFYIYNITSAGTFLVTLQYGGMQKQIDAQNEEISNVESLVYSGFNNGAYAIGGTEIPGVETTDNCLLLWNSGKPFEYAHPAWKVKKYPVTPRTNYHLVGSTNYGNAVFSVIDSNDIVIYKEKGATSGQEIIDKIYCTPEAAAFIYVAYVTTIKDGMLTNVEIVPNEEPETPGKWTGKKWVAIGDSLTEINSRTTKHYFDYIAEKTGISVVNMGLSGSGYRRKFDTNQAFYQRVANVPTDADVITIFGSFNDLGVADYAVGEPTDTGTDTICGCINNTLDTILSVYMNAEKVPTIGVITPTPWIGTGPADPTNSSSVYCDAVIACCKRRSIPVLDLFRCSNLHPNNATFRTLAYSKDDGNGVHPDETGHKIIAPMFENFLESLLLN